jgi:hypothetical protein
MNGQPKTIRAYVGELSALLERFGELVEMENAAIERHDTAALRRLAMVKIDTPAGLRGAVARVPAPLRHVDPRTGVPSAS